MESISWRWVMIEILQPGIQSSIQDVRPRRGLSQGVSLSGAADSHAAQLANIILGQDPSLPVLEIVSSTFSVHFTESCVIAITGGGMLWHISSEESLPSNEHLSDLGDQRTLHLGSWRKWIIPPATTLTGRPSRPGFRSYLGVASGLQSETWLNSRSTELRLGIGGSQSALKKGDTLHPINPIPAPRPPTSPRSWHISRDFTHYLHQNEIRIFPGPESDWFSQPTLHAFTNQSWSVSRDSNRMGFRLQTDAKPDLTLPDRNLISTVVLPGTIQMTPSGPIILGPDAQTSGGYPRIAQVCLADQPILAQKSPGESIRFKWISLAEAITLVDQHEKDLKQLANAVALHHLT